MVEGIPRDARARVGEVLDGRYELVELLESGAVGDVYRARDRRLEFREVAVKLLKPDTPPDQVARFKREALLAGGLTSPHLVGVSDFGTMDDGQSYLVMELLQGESLFALLEREKRLPVERAVHLADGVLAGLEAAHNAGVVHRDLKPENIFVVAGPGFRDHAKVVDFGFARLFDGAVAALDVTGELRVVAGTVSYMAPEQLQARRVDHRADLYSLSAILFRMVSGKMPYPVAEPGSPMTAAARYRMTHLADPPVALRAAAPELMDCEALEAVLLRALAPEPEKRPQSAGELRRALAEAVGVTLPPQASAPGAGAGVWRFPASGLDDLVLHPPARSAAVPAPSGASAAPAIRPRRLLITIVGTIVAAGVIVVAATAFFTWRALR